MSGSTGHNFNANPLIRSSQVNENFEWFRGHYLPITQSSTWANTTGVYDLGSSTYKWRTLYCNSVSSANINTTNLSVTSTISSAYISSQNIALTGSGSPGPPATNTAYKQSFVKCWLNYNHIAATINDHLNVSSVTDNGVGDLSINFQTNFVGYLAAACLSDTGYHISVYATSAGQISVRTYDSANTLIKTAFFHMSVSGDQS